MPAGTRVSNRCTGPRALLMVSRQQGDRREPELSQTRQKHLQVSELPSGGREGSGLSREAGRRVPQLPVVPQGARSSEAPPEKFLCGDYTFCVCVCVCVCETSHFQNVGLKLELCALMAGM